MPPDFLFKGRTTTFASPSLTNLQKPKVFCRRHILNQKGGQPPYGRTPGSVAIDGISLTVAKVDEKEFAVSVIPHTGEETTLLSKKAGDIVNLENDVIGKYVQKLMNHVNSEQSEKDKKLLDWLNG